MIDFQVTPYLMQNYHPIPESGCWLWLGGWGNRGYGRVSKNGRLVCTAHRLFYAVHVGQIPDGISVLHKCDTPICVNPDHLFIGTTRDNAIDRERKNRGRHRNVVPTKVRRAIYKPYPATPIAIGEPT